MLPVFQTILRIANKTHFQSPFLYISIVNHSLFLISLQTRVGWSIGLQAVLPSRELCVRLPSIWSIMCLSSNASYGPLIKRGLKSGGSKWKEKTECFCSHTVQTWGQVHLLHTKQVYTSPLMNQIYSPNFKLYFRDLNGKEKSLGLWVGVMRDIHQTSYYILIF